MSTIWICVSVYIYYIYTRYINSCAGGAGRGSLCNLHYYEEEDLTHTLINPRDIDTREKDISLWG